MAADLLSEYSKKVGVQPMPGDGGYFNTLKFNAGERVDTAKSALNIKEGAPTVFPAIFDFQLE